MQFYEYFDLRLSKLNPTFYFKDMHWSFKLLLFLEATN